MNQLELMVYSSYNHFAVIHIDREIGILLLRELAPVPVCMGRLCTVWAAVNSEHSDLPSFGSGRIYLTISLSSSCLPSELKCFCFPDTL